MERKPKPRPSVKKKAAKRDASRASREAARRDHEEKRTARDQVAARDQATASQKKPASETKFATELAAAARIEAPSTSTNASSREFFAAKETVAIPRVSTNSERAVRNHFEDATQSSSFRQDITRFYEPSLDQRDYLEESRQRRRESLDRFAQDNGSAVGMSTAQSYKRKRNPIGIAFRFLCAVVAVAAFMSIVVLGTLTVAEFRPRDTSVLKVENPAEPMMKSGQSFSILTWNVGYAGNPSNSSNYIDEGTGVRAESSESVKENMTSIENVVIEENADFTFLQEVDRASDRSFKVNEEKSVSITMETLGYSSVFAQDYKALYIPHPWPFLGAVDSGTMTESKYSIESAERFSLPKAQSWPISLISPKACVLIEKIPIEDSNKQLVLMNVRFDDHATEEVREAQTRELALLMKREVDKGNYVVAGGDFDQNFSSIDVKMYGKEISRIRSTGVIDEGIFAEGMQFEMDSSNPTMRSLNAAYEGDDSNIRFYVSDGFIVSSNITVDSVTTINKEFKNSDHNPVKINLTLN